MPVQCACYKFDSARPFSTFTRTTEYLRIWLEFIHERSRDKFSLRCCNLIWHFETSQIQQNNFFVLFDKTLWMRNYVRWMDLNLLRFPSSPFWLNSPLKRYPSKWIRLLLTSSVYIIIKHQLNGNNIYTSIDNYLLFKDGKRQQSERTLKWMLKLRPHIRFLSWLWQKYSSKRRFHKKIKVNTNFFSFSVPKKTSLRKSLEYSQWLYSWVGVTKGKKLLKSWTC